MQEEKKKYRSLGAKIIRYTIIPIILVSVLSCLVCFFYLQESIEGKIEQEIETQWQKVDEALSPFMECFDQRTVDTVFREEANRFFENITSYISKQNNLYYGSYQAVLDNLYMEYEGSVSTVWSADLRTGMFFTNSQYNFSAYRVNYDKTNWYEVDLLDKVDYYISQEYVSQLKGGAGAEFDEKGKKVISIVYIIRNDENKITGFVGFNILTDQIREALGTMEELNTDYAVFTEYGDILMQTDRFEKDPKLFSEVMERCVDAANKDSKVSYSDEDRSILVEGFHEGNHGLYCAITASKSNLAAEAAGMMKPILVAFIGGDIALFLCMIVISSSIIRPLKTLIVNTKKAGQGDFNLSVDIHMDDELGELIDSFNWSMSKLKHKAEHDSLTDLYNQDRFIKAAKEHLKDFDRQYVVIRMDIDQFKVINDLYDWEEGNKLLIHIANVIKRECEGMVYGRQNADIFHICMTYNDFSEITNLIERIRKGICEYEINLNLYPHFGICKCVHRSTPIHILCDRAGIALKQIKGNILTVYSVYDERLEEKVMNRKFVEVQKETAMLNHEFFIQMQPKIDMNTGKIAGAEALVRWRHPERGIIRPDTFIPVFERDGYILNLDEFVWEESCKYIGKWLKQGIQIPVSVNVSRMHIYDLSFIQKLIDLTEYYHIPKHLLELEFTESALLDDVDDLYRVMEELKDMGFPLVMDDFASGYSSLNMLKALNFDVVKLDKEFVDEVAQNDKSYKLVAGTIDLLKGLNIKIVGEGIETEAQVRKLKNAGLIIAQGYYYSQPLNMDDFEARLYEDYQKK